MYCSLLLGTVTTLHRSQAEHEYSHVDYRVVIGESCDEQPTRRRRGRLPWCVDCGLCRGRGVRACDGEQRRSATLVHARSMAIAAQTAVKRGIIGRLSQLNELPLLPRPWKRKMGRMHIFANGNRARGVRVYAVYCIRL